MQLTRIEPIFREVGISRAWLYGLTYGCVYHYNNDTEVLSYFYDKGELNIYASSIGDKRFSRELLLHLEYLIMTNDRVFLPTTLTSIGRYLKRLGMYYVPDEEAYYKEAK